MGSKHTSAFLSIALHKSGSLHLIPFPLSLSQTKMMKKYLKILAQKIKLPQMNFFLEKQLTKFSCTYWPLSFWKIFKKFFKIKKILICHEQLFWYKPLLLLSSTYCPFSLCKILKILTADPQLWGCAIFGAKMGHFPKWEFFSENLLMSLVSFIHAYLHAKNQNQILIY